jgi:glucose/arabinose dehydrogenase
MHNVPVTTQADFPQPPFPPGAAPNSQEVIAEWRVDRHADTVDLMSYRELLRYDKPEFNHNGGTIIFGADDNLYASIGDGGAANDVGPGHIPGTGNAQILGTILGKVIRINPLDPRRTRHKDGIISANGAYRIPNDNPFVSTPGAVREIFAYGFRNPYRMSFDRKGNRLIVADVGQDNIEEVDIVTRGGNYGWHLKEGTFLFDPQTGHVSIDQNPDPRLIDPVVEYDHNPSEAIRVAKYQAVIGGFVYRGSKIPELRGKYVFADLTGFLFVADLSNGNLAKLIDSGIFIKGFGEDDDGEIYALGSPEIGPSGSDGVVLAIKPVREKRSRADH